MVRRTRTIELFIAYTYFVTLYDQSNCVKTWWSVTEPSKCIGHVLSNIDNNIVFLFTKVKVVCETRDLKHARQLQEVVKKNYSSSVFGDIPLPKVL